MEIYKKYLLLCVLSTVMLLSLGLGSSESESTDNFAWIEESDPGEILPGVNPLNVQGDIIIAGSSTVFPLAERLATRFREEGYAYNISIDSIGSGAGFERFSVSTETDISMASRPIKESEEEAARNNNRMPLEFRVGTDALAIVVHPDNDWIEEADLELLSKIFTAESWNDVNPAWPKRPLLKFVPGTDSGTFDYFIEEVFHKDAKPLLDAANLQMSEDDNILARGISGNKNAIGFFGYAYYAENQNVISVLAIDGITPSAASVADASYPLARPLFLYSASTIMQEKPQVAAFLNFVLSYVNEEILNVGYFPAMEQEIDDAKEIWIQSMKGLY